MKSLSFFIPIEPMPRGDPESCVMWNHGKATSRLFQPAEYTAYKKRLATAAYLLLKAHDMGRMVPFSQPLIVGWTFYLSRARTIFRQGKPCQIVHGQLHHMIKPDLSNLIKAAEDSLTGILWTDDKIIVGYDPSPYKYFADNDRGLGIDIIVRPCGQQEFNEVQDEIFQKRETIS